MNFSFVAEMDMFDPSPEVVYLCHLEYMGILCELIVEKFSRGERETEWRIIIYN